MAHHAGISEEFTFSAEVVPDHLTGIALWDVPARPPVTEVTVGEEFDVEIAVICLTAGCSLRGKNIQVRDHNYVLVGSGTLTDTFYNLRYMKWAFRGRVRVKAPLEAGVYTWIAEFPRQSKHSSAEVSFGISAGLGFPSPPEEAIV